MTNSWKRRIVWRLLTWLWIVPVLLFPVAWEVTPVGWAIIGFLILGWATGIFIQIRSAYRWTQSFDPGALSSAITLRTSWPVMAHRADLLDTNENGPELVAVTPAPCGWIATLETHDHTKEVNALENHRGLLRRMLKIQEVTVAEKTAGTVELRGFVSDPLKGIRPVIEPGTLHKYGIRIGRQQEGDDLTLNIAKAAGHIALQGATRSGKSVTSYAILSQCATDPKIEVWGIDPTGVLLSPWRDHPGKRVCGLEHLDHCVEVIDQAVNEMSLRLHDLDYQGVDKIEPDTSTPALLMVLEEWPATLKALKDGDLGLKTAEKREGRVRAGVSRLIAEGAKVGIKVMMIAQRFDASIIGGAERSNIAYRITHRVDNGDAVRMLHPIATPELVDTVTGFQPGRALAEWPGENPAIFQADLIEYQDYAQRVRQATRKTRIGRQA